jgi:ATP synthase F1 delta subunit
MNKIDLGKLLELAGDKAEKLEREWHELSRERELIDVLGDPRQTAEMKKSLVKEVFSGKSHLFIELIGLLIDQDLARSIPKLSEEFTRLVAAKEKVRYDELVFPEKPSEELLAKFNKLAGDKVKFRVSIDKELIGGFIWKTMDGRVMDASIAGRLSKIKEEISA